jgi:hypothetical protein
LSVAACLLEVAAHSARSLLGEAELELELELVVWWCVVGSEPSSLSLFFSLRRKQQQ